MKNPKRYTITAALPYTNGPIHIGHLSGVYIPADIYARYLKLKDKDVIFICGSDEHGVPIKLKADKEGVTPKEIVDRYHEMIKSSFDRFGIHFDHYSRTTNPTHNSTASDFFKKLHEQDKFIEKETEQLYDPEAEQFLADRFVEGTCPKCGFEEAYGDQCESCGTSLSSQELINPRSKISGSKPITKRTKHWFLPLNEYEPWLKQWILEDHKKDWKPNVYGQCKSWIDEGLQPRAVTRDLDWGIKVPLENAEGKVLYVWFDAPIGYISSTKEWAEANNRNWEEYWKDKDTKLVHFIGKDNIVFHCIIFPIMLKAEGSFILPDNVPANEFLNLEGRKLSTSKNWAVWLHEYLEEFPGKEDVLRYVLTANAPETKDNDFTWKDFQARNNNELVAIVGNFINRVTVLTHKYFKAYVPEYKDLDEASIKALQLLNDHPEKIGDKIETYKFREAQNMWLSLARAGNKYLAEKEPWKSIKTNEQETKNTLYVALQISAALAVLGRPFLPITCKKLYDILKLDEEITWNDITDKAEYLPVGHRIGQSEHLFTKIDDKTIQKQQDKLFQNTDDKESTDHKPIKNAIDFNDFQKLDIRAGSILSAKEVKGSDKLLELKVDIGLEKRTIVSGMAKHYSLDQLPGKSVLVVANLEPKKLMGIKSNGMILMAETSEGLSLANVPENAKPGDVIN